MKNLDNNLGKLQISLMDEQSFTKEDFIKAFETVVKFVVEMKKQFEDAIAGLQKAHHMSMETVSNDYATRHNELKGQVNEVFVGDKIKEMQANHEQMMKMITDKLSTIKNGKDGIQGPRGFQGIPGKSGLTGKVDLQIIQDLKEAMKLLNKKIDNKVMYVGSPSRGTLKALDLSSSLDGVTKTFNTQAIWKVISVHLSSIPNILRETTDYTWTPTSITFTSEINASTSLASGQTCIVIIAEA